MNSVEAIAELVRQGYGIAVLPLLANADWQRNRQLAVKPLPGPAVIRRVGMLERRHHGKKPLTEAVRNMFAQSAQ